MTIIADPKLVLKKLLAAEWDDTNTGGVTPEFRTGWRDEDLPGPQVTFGPDDESPDSPTGFTGIKPDGSGPTANTRGTCQVHAWATHDTQAANGKSAARDLANEAKRLVKKHYDVSEYSGWPITGTEPTEYRWIAPNGVRFLPESPQESDGDLVFHYFLKVRYGYLDEPE